MPNTGPSTAEEMANAPPITPVATTDRVSRYTQNVSANHRNVLVTPVTSVLASRRRKVCSIGVQTAPAAETHRGFSGKGHLAFGAMVIAARIVGFLAGAVLALSVLGSALRTVVVPRAESSLLTRAVFYGTRKVFDLRVRRAKTWEDGDRIMARVRAGRPHRAARRVGRRDGRRIRPDVLGARK